MPILVAKISNLFWSNNSYKKPNDLPEFEKSQEVKISSQIFDYMGGIVHLIGDEWNYAIHEGTYYFLKIDKVRDVKTKHYTYALIRDLWMNIIMKHSCLIRGRLTCTNNDEWLKRNINRAFPILYSPVNVRRINLKDTDYKLNKHVKTKKITKEFPMKLVGRSELNQIKEEWIEDAKAFKWMTQKGYYITNKHPLIIFSYLKGSDTLDGSWKEKVKKIANKFLEEITKNEEIIISKVNPSIGSNLSNNYCITWKNKGIGIGEENVKIDLIDLSQITDIVPIKKNTLQPLDKFSANKNLSEISIIDQGEIYEKPLLKFRRQIYFPITSNVSECGIALKEDEDTYEVKTNWNWISPQRIRLYDENEIFLMWIDDVNFQLNYSKKFEIWSRSLREHYNSMMDFYKKIESFNTGETITRYGDKWITRPIKEIFPFMSFSHDERWEHNAFYNRPFTNEMGFLLFQFDRHKFDRFKYTGQKSRKISYYSGIDKHNWNLIKKGLKISKDLEWKLPYKVENVWNTKIIKEDWFTNWHEYLWNLYNGLHLLLRINSKNVLSSWVSNKNNDPTTGAYAVRLLSAVNSRNIFEKNKSPYVSEEQHKLSILKAKRLIDNITLETEIELPTEIDQGDFLINGLEYRLDKYNPSWINRKARVTGIEGFNYSEADDYANHISGEYIKEFWRAWYKLEDYIEEGSYDLDSTVIIHNNENKLQISELRKFNVNHKLKSGTNQAASSVDGGTGKTITHYLIKKIKEINLTDSYTTLTDIYTLNALYSFYKSKGYILSEKTETENTFSAKILWYDDEDLKGKEEILFDLVGTDWYIFIKDEKTSLIAKKANIFQTVTHKIKNIPEVESIKNLSVLEKVNQLCTLNIYTKQIPLKTKFNFDGSEGIDMELTSIIPTHKKTPTNYFLFKMRSDFDAAEREIISIQKNELEESASMMDQITMENLRVQMARNDRDYVYSMDRIALEREMLNEEMRRRQFDLDTTKMKYWLNSALNLGVTLAPQYTLTNSSALSNNLLKSFGVTRNSIRSSQIMPKTFKFDNFPLYYPHQVMDEHPEYFFPKYTGKRKRKGSPWQNRNSLSENFGEYHSTSSVLGKEITSAGLMGVQQVGNMIIQGTRIFPEMQERINTDKKFAFRNLAYETLAIDLTHRDIQEDQIRTINNIANIYHKGSLNEMSIVDQFNKQNKDESGENLANIYLTIFTPSDEQLKVMKEHKKEFGIECDIPDAIVEISRGMGEDVIRFRNLEDKGIEGLSVIKERSYLAAMLEMGIKVVDLEEKPFDSDAYTCVNIHNLKTELSEKISTDEKSMRLIENLTHELNEAINKREEAVRRANQLEEQQKVWETCENDKIEHVKKIAELQTQLEQEKSNIEDIRKQIDAKQEEIKQLKIEKEMAEEKEANALREKLNIKAEFDRYKKEGNPSNDGFRKLVCETLKDIAKDSDYRIDINKQESGWSDFIELCLTIGRSLGWIRRSNIEQHLSQYEQIRKITELLYELERLPPIDVAEDISSNNYFSTWKNNMLIEDPNKLQKLKEMRTNPIYKNVFKSFDNLSNNLSSPMYVNAVRETLDELFLLSHKAQEELKEQTKSDDQLYHFFSHFFPGQKIKEQYEKVYKIKPEVAIFKKTVLNKVDTCQNEDISKFLEEERAKININIEATKESSKPHIPPISPVVSLIGVENRLKGKVSLNEKEIIPFILPKINPEISIDRNPDRDMKTLKSSSTEDYVQKFLVNPKNESLWYDSYKKYQRITWTVTIRNIGINIGKIGNSKTKSFLLGAENLNNNKIKKGDFRKIYITRKELWKNRNAIQLSEETEQKIENGTLTVNLKIRNWKLSKVLNNKENFGKYRSDIKYVFDRDTNNDDVNLVKLFGKDGARDAYKLICIMDSTKALFRYFGEYVGYSETLSKLLLNIRLCDMNKLQNEYLEQRKEKIIGENEFIDDYSLFNYIYKHVKNPDMELENNFSAYSTKNIEDLYESVISATQ